MTVVAAGRALAAPICRVPTATPVFPQVLPLLAIVQVPASVLETPPPVRLMLPSMRLFALVEPPRRKSTEPPDMLPVMSPVTLMLNVRAFCLIWSRIKVRFLLPHRMLENLLMFF